MSSSTGFEKRMTTIAKWVEEKISPPLLRIGNQRHLLAVRSGLIRIIPLIIVGSIPLILTNLPVESWAMAMEPYEDSLNTFFTMTFGFMGLFLAISMAAELAILYKLETTMVSIVTAVCFIISVAPVDLESGTISIEYFGSTGIFTAILVSIIVAEVLRFANEKKITIK